MDFEISTDGDLVNNNNNISNVNGIKEYIQIAMCSIASISHDWFYDNIGCNLEQVLGSPNNDNTLAVVESLIRDEINKIGCFDIGKIKIKNEIIENEYIGVNVYIPDDKIQYYYHIIQVKLDLIEGTNVYYGGAEKCLF